METKKRGNGDLTKLACLTAVGIALHIAEGMWPAVGAVPGGKIGLANVVTVVVLECFGAPWAFAVGMVRALTGSLLVGASASVYAVAGAFFSTLTMIGCKRFFGKYLSVIGLSIAGAAAHNIGQVAVAYVLLKSNALLSYLTFLLVLSVASGIAVGVAASFAVHHMKRIMY